MLNFFEHFLAFFVKVPPHIKILVCLAVFVFLILVLSVLLDFPHFFSLKAEDVIDVALVNTHIFALTVGLMFLKQLNVDLHALFYPVVTDGPPCYDAIVDLALPHPHDEAALALPHSLANVFK